MKRPGRDRRPRAIPTANGRVRVDVRSTNQGGSQNRPPSDPGQGPLPRSDCVHEARKGARSAVLREELLLSAQKKGPLTKRRSRRGHEVPQHGPRGRHEAVMTAPCIEAVVSAAGSPHGHRSGTATLHGASSTRRRSRYGDPGGGQGFGLPCRIPSSAARDRRQIDSGAYATNRRRKPCRSFATFPTPRNGTLREPFRTMWTFRRTD